MDDRISFPRASTQSILAPLDGAGLIGRVLLTYCDHRLNLRAYHLLVEIVPVGCLDEEYTFLEERPRVVLTPGSIILRAVHRRGSWPVADRGAVCHPGRSFEGGWEALAGLDKESGLSETISIGLFYQLGSAVQEYAGDGSGNKLSDIDGGESWGVVEYVSCSGIVCGINELCVNEAGTMIVMMICELCDLCDPRGDCSERGWGGGRERGSKYPIERTKRGNLFVFQVNLPIKRQQAQMGARPSPAMITDHQRGLFHRSAPSAFIC